MLPDPIEATASLNNVSLCHDLRGAGTPLLLNGSRNAIEAGIMAREQFDSTCSGQTDRDAPRSLTRVKTYLVRANLLRSVCPFDEVGIGFCRAAQLSRFPAMPASVVGQPVLGTLHPPSNRLC